MKRIALALIGALGAGMLAGCPSDPYSADTWIPKLDDPHEMERAITELQQLCDPKAIPALGKAWQRESRPTRILQVIIELSDSLTPTDPNNKGADGKPIPGTAEQRNCTDYVKKGRPASWDLSLPFLQEAIEKYDSNSDRQVDGAVKAADALGNAANGADAQAKEQLAGSSDILIGAINRKLAKPNDKGHKVRLASILALAKYKDKRAIQTLANVLKADQSTQPPNIPGAAIIALGDMEDPDTIPVLLDAMYRTRGYFQKQIREALVRTGGTVREDLRKILRGEHNDIKALFAEKKLDKYCGEGAQQLAPSECEDVSAMDFYAAAVIGDLYDRQAVPDLLAALKKTPKPAYFSNDTPGPPAHNAILDALRKIGDPETADEVLALIASSNQDPRLRAFAMSVYAFISPDGGEKAGAKTGLQLLGDIAADNGADQSMRLAASEAFSQLASDDSRIAVMKKLAGDYATASTKAKKELDDYKAKTFNDAEAKFKAAAEAHDKAKLEAEAEKLRVKGRLEEMDTAILEKAANAKLAFDKVKKETYDPAKAKFDGLDAQVKGYKSYQRGFENGIARIEIASYCKKQGDVQKCLVETFDADPNKVFERLKTAKYVSDDGWTDAEKAELKVSQIQRAVLELRRLGEKARPSLAALLAQLPKETSADPMIRSSITLALPRIAALPCKECETALEEAIKAGKGKKEVEQVNEETEIVLNFYRINNKRAEAGGK